MTDSTKPTSIKLDPQNWKAIVMADMTDIGQNLQKAALMEPAGLEWLDKRWQRFRQHFMAGWEIASRPFIQEALKQQEAAAEQPIPQRPAAQPNGPIAAKKNKGGRPKGSRNKPSAEVLPPVTQ